MRHIGGKVVTERLPEFRGTYENFGGPVYRQDEVTRASGLATFSGPVVEIHAPSEQDIRFAENTKDWHPGGG